MSSLLETKHLFNQAPKLARFGSEGQGDFTWGQTQPAEQSSSHHGPCPLAFTRLTADT